MLLIDEVLEVKDYLDGKNIDKKCIYRICYLIAKYYKQQGLPFLEIRDKIFYWGKQHNVYISCNLNGIINRVLKDNVPLRESSIVRISNSDIDEITRRFDSKPLRLFALSLLCLSKVSANNKGEFDCSISAVSNWIKVNRGNLNHRYLTELINYRYIERTSDEKVLSWNGNVKSKSLMLKMNVPLRNNGKYKLDGNDIFGLYNLIFKKNLSVIE